MKILSFNVNSVRTRLHQIDAIIKKHSPDVIGLQETKVQDAEFPVEDILNMGYKPHIFGQKGHYGVAILSKKEPVALTKGFTTDTEDSQKRLISATFASDTGEKYTVINGYFPQGESRDHPVKFPAKDKFYKDLLIHLNSNFSINDNLVIIGDMNIAPTDLDVGLGGDNAKRWLKTGKCCFLPEEREWMGNLMNWGLTDTYRNLNPGKDDLYSWFDYRSKGFEAEPKRGLRIDLLLATKPIADKALESGIDYEIRSMERPSDHCPVWTEFNI